MPVTTASNVDTIFFVDWDDTLFASSWLAKTNFTSSKSDMTPDEDDLLAQLETAVHKALTSLLRLGRVVILSSASREWIDKTMNIFFPSLRAVTRHAEIVSARDLFSRKFPDQPTAWKFHAMRDIFAEHQATRTVESNAQLDLAVPLQVISIGDSLQEREAVWTLIYVVPDLVVKSVKFLDRPHLAHLVEQLGILHDTIHDIVRQEGNMDYFMSPKEGAALLGQ